MGRAIFVPYNDNVWIDYYLSQAKQTGHGMSGYQGIPYQRGSGLGSFFGRLLRTILPVAKRIGKSALKTVGKEALNMGAAVMNDVVQGKNIKQSVKKRGAKAGKNLLYKAAEGFPNQSGGQIGKRPAVSRINRVPAKRRNKKQQDIFD
jgi:hypothetical protein